MAVSDEETRIHELWKKSEDAMAVQHRDDQEKVSNFKNQNRNWNEKHNEMSRYIANQDARLTYQEQGAEGLRDIIAVLKGRENMAKGRGDSL